MNELSEQVSVSIICTTYNQEEYISRALNSLVTQKTNFKYEIIVHDDCSTDQTSAIVRSFEEKYQGLIRAVYQKENQYSKGIDVCMKICVPMARGKYIAICEGDDYWTDENKIQLQYETLEAHLESDMCACGAVSVKAKDEKIIQNIEPKTEDAVLSIQEVILGGGRYLATASLFFRKELFLESMSFEKVITFDYTMQIKGALRGGIIYLNKNMAAYRVFADNSWSQRVEHNVEKRNRHIKKEISMLKELDKELQYIYHDIIEERLKAYTPFIKQLKSHKNEIFEEIKDKKGKMYIWGLGTRGEACQEFFLDSKIDVFGACDIKNDCVGECTAYGIKIYHTDYVFYKADIIIATNIHAYTSIVERGYLGTVINLQKYMPLS